jgi:glucose-6-phosphate 1-dehydrogenase
MPVTATEVNVTFKRPPLEVFDEADHGSPNRLRLCLSPEVVIGLRMRVKLPGEQMDGEDVELIAKHQQADEMAPYERLLADALRGDQALFAREDQIEAQWRIVEPVLGDVTPVHEYEQNTWGPVEAASLMQDPGGWLNPQLPAIRA